VFFVKKSNTLLFFIQRKFIIVIKMEWKTPIKRKTSTIIGVAD
jgi:hypothetical protein